MKYVYLVYEECHGLIGVYENPEDATKRVKQDVFEWSPELLNLPLDYNSQWHWGWEGASYWKREEVL